MDSVLQWLRNLELAQFTADILFTILGVVVFAVLFKLLQIGVRRARAKVSSWEGTRIHTLRIQRQELLPASTMVGMISGVIRFLQIVIILVLAYALVDFVFSLYETTAGLAQILLDQVTGMLGSAGQAFIDYLPNLLSILVILFLTIQVNRLIGVLFSGIRTGRIRLGGFYPEWAGTTVKLIRFFVFIFAAIMVFPYLPGSGSSAFQGISIFVGVIISLGSTAAIANVVAGVVLTYTRAFQVGDYVRIADTSGRVMEKTFFVTNIRTLKNEETSIPNAMVLAGHIVNYSKQGDGKGIILHTTVTIGYDVPWRKVQELLLSAAASVEELENDPAPFVLQTALGDFYVAYELNVTTKRPERMPRVYSALHEAIQDRFHEAGVEIMSPHYAAMRDGNAAAIPGEHLPPSYAPGAFRVHVPGSLPASYRADSGPAGGGPGTGKRG